MLAHKDSILLQQQVSRTVHGNSSKKEDTLRTDIAKMERELTTLAQRQEQLRSELVHIKQSSADDSNNERIHQLEAQFQRSKESYHRTRTARITNPRIQVQLDTLRQQERLDIASVIEESKPSSFWYTLSLLGQTDGIIRFFVRSIIVLLISSPILFWDDAIGKFFSIYIANNPL